MAEESLLNINWNKGDEITAAELNNHGQAHLDLDGHGDALHSVQYIKALTGGDGIDPASIGDGDTLSVAWEDAADLDSNGNVTSGGGGGIGSLSGGDGINPASIGDGDTLSVAWGDAADLGTAGGISSGAVDASALGVSPFTYDPGMTEFESGLLGEEVNRLSLQSGAALVVDRIEFRQKGGGSSSTAALTVKDETANTAVGEQALGGTTISPGSSSTGSLVTVRLTNQSGSAISAAPRVSGFITGLSGLVAGV